MGNLVFDLVQGNKNHFYLFKKHKEDTPSGAGLK